MLECAACKAPVPEGADRCPRCGGGRLLAPPSLLQRRGVLVAVYGAGAALGGVWLAANVGIQFLAFWDRALAALGRSPSQLGARERHDRLVEAVRDAERSVPVFPGAARLRERPTENRIETAPVVESCWGAPGPLDEVLAYYRRVLPGGQGGWRIRRDAPGSGQLGAEAGQVRLLIGGQGPGLASGVDCPPETVYVLSFTAFSGGR